MGVDLPTLPAGLTQSKVVKATLVLYINRIRTAGAVEVRTTLSGWTEAVVTNGGAPALSGPGTGPTTPVAARVLHRQCDRRPTGASGGQHPWREVGAVW